MIGCDKLYGTYNGCKTVLHMRNTRVKLDEPGMYKHGLGTPETERSNVNHIVDMINIEMFTIDDYPISRDDRTWLVDLDHVYFR